MDYGMPFLIENETLENCTDMCRDLGLQFVELNMNFPQCQLDVLHAAELNRIRKEKGIYFTIHVDENFNICDFNTEVRRAYMQTMMGAIRLAKEIAAPIINMHFARGIRVTLPERKVVLFEQYSEYFMKSILDFRQMCEKEILENSGSNMDDTTKGNVGCQPMIAIENTDGFLDYEKRAIECLLESKCFGLTLDIGHSHAVEDVDIPFYRKHTKQLIHMHAHDAKGTSNHLAFGDGEIDLRERLAWAEQENVRVVLETKTIDALTRTVQCIRADRKVDKERLWVFAPVYLVVSKAEITGDMTVAVLREAIKTATAAHELLQQKIVLDDDWNAYYSPCEPFPFVIEEYEGDWREVVYAQEKIPYAIERGEFIRFFLQKRADGVSVMFVAHHLAGDGTSYAYLLQDILRAAAGEHVEYKPLHLFSMDSLPKKSQLTFPMRLLMNNMNQKWNRTKRQFTLEEAGKLHHDYWQKHTSVIIEEAIEEEVYDAIIKNARAHDVTINSVLTTAMIQAADELSDVGHAASIREAGYTGMGNFATGISTRYQYKKSLDFWKNAKNVQKLMYHKLQNPAKKYFLLQFMGQIEPTLIDAIYFAACTDYNNSTAMTFAKMFGYAENPKGISITNLTKLPIAEDYGKFRLTDYTFVPPLVLNSQRIIGVATIGKHMKITLHLNQDQNEEIHQAFFNRGIDYLKQLGV